MNIRPFRGWRPGRELAARVASYPYDVIDSDEARSLAEGNPYSFLHVVKPEIDLEPDASPYDDRVYSTGRSNLDRMIEEGWLQQDEQPAFYLYRQAIDDHSQTGIVALAGVSDYLEGRIKKHELTREDKEADRTRHIQALAAHTGPVMQCYRRVPELSALVNGSTARDPDIDFEADDGVRHSIWVVRDEVAHQRIADLFSKIPATYIADGHHRAAAASRAAREAGREETAGFLTVLFPGNQLRILDYNRVVRDLNGLDGPSMLEKLEQNGFAVTHNHQNRRPQHRGSFGMYLEGRWYLLTPSQKEQNKSNNPAEELDVALLTRGVLEPILGLGDLRKDKRIGFVGGSRGMEELERLVDLGGQAVAFALYPADIEDVMSVADTGGIMPPKTTWFEPKLRSGLVVHRFGETKG